MVWQRFEVEGEVTFMTDAALSHKRTSSSCGRGRGLGSSRLA